MNYIFNFKYAKIIDKHGTDHKTKRGFIESPLIHYRPHTVNYKKDLMMNKPQLLPHGKLFNSR